MISQTLAGIMELDTLHKWFGKAQPKSDVVLLMDGFAVDILHQETIWGNLNKMSSHQMELMLEWMTYGKMMLEMMLIWMLEQTHPILLLQMLILRNLIKL